jgi:hypothetical protein
MKVTLNMYNASLGEVLEAIRWQVRPKEGGWCGRRRTGCW